MSKKLCKCFFENVLNVPEKQVSKITKKDYVSWYISKETIVPTAVT